MKSSSFAWLCVALLATAAETKAEKLDTLKTYELQNVQVTATRAQHNTPMTFSNLTQHELAKHNHGQDIPSLLSFMPSVTFTSDAGNGIGYTALKVRGTDPSRINFTANGIPLNDAESSQVFNQWQCGLRSYGKSANRCAFSETVCDALDRSG